VDEKAIREAKGRNIDVTFVFIRTDNELLKRNFPCVYLECAKPEVIMEL